MDILTKAIEDSNKGDVGSYVDNRLKKRKSRRYKRKSRRYKRKKKTSSKKQPVEQKISSDSDSVSDEMKLQTSLLGLGYYHGVIDGEINNFETRKAIKAMNQAFGKGDILFLDDQAKKMLIYLADIYGFKQNLTSNDTSEDSKNIKLQTALKVLGFYHGEIDGLVGSETRSSILQYKEANNMNKDDKLDVEEGHQLVSKAIDKNRQYIEEAKEGLKRNQSKPEKIKSMENNNTYTVKKDINTHSKPVPEKIQKPQSDIGMSDSFE